MPCTCRHTLIPPNEISTCKPTPPSSQLTTPALASVINGQYFRFLAAAAESIAECCTPDQQPKTQRAPTYGLSLIPLQPGWKAIYVNTVNTVKGCVWTAVTNPTCFQVCLGLIPLNPGWTLIRVNAVHMVRSSLGCDNRSSRSPLFQGFVWLQ